MDAEVVNAYMIITKNVYSFVLHYTKFGYVLCLRIFEVNLF